MDEHIVFIHRSLDSCNCQLGNENMKKTMAIIAASLMLGCIIGCQTPMPDKTVLAESDGAMIKASSLVDASSATPAPTVWMGLFNLLWLTHPKDAPSVVFYKQTSAVFNADAKTTTYVFIGSGIKADVKVEPDKIVNLPGLAIVSGSNTVSIVANTAVPSSSTETDSSKNRGFHGTHRAPCRDQ